MIRNVILHLVGEQPMLADLLVRPQPSDVSLVCTNLRTIDGKRPRSVESSEGVFLIPVATARIVELPARELKAMMAAGAGTRRESGAAIELPASGETDASAEGSEGWPADGGPDGEGDLTDAGGRGLVPLESDLERDIEPDEDLLRRIREV